MKTKWKSCRSSDRESGQERDEPAQHAYQTQAVLQGDEPWLGCGRDRQPGLARGGGQQDGYRRGGQGLLLLTGTAVEAVSPDCQL